MQQWTRNPREARRVDFEKDLEKWKGSKRFYLGLFPNTIKSKRAERKSSEKCGKREREELWILESVVNCCCEVDCEEEEEREGSMSHALLQLLPNREKWRVQWREGTFQHGRAMWWGGVHGRRYPIYSACECGGYVIPKVSRVGPIETRLTGWAGPVAQPPWAHALVSHLSLTFHSI